MGRVVIPMATPTDIGTALRTGEARTGLVYAVSGDRLLCVAPGGMRLEVPAEQSRPGPGGRILTPSSVTVYHTVNEPGRRCA